MEGSSSEDLSRNLSDLNFTSNASSALSTTPISSTTQSRNSKQNVKHDAAEAAGGTASSDTVDESPDEKREGTSRQSTNVARSRESTNVSKSREGTNVSISGESTNVSRSRESTNVSISRESTNVSVSAESTVSISRESTNVSDSDLKDVLKENSIGNEDISKKGTPASELEHTSRESSIAPEKSLAGESPSADIDQLVESDSSQGIATSRESTMSINKGIATSRESTMSINSKVYSDNFDKSFENTMSTSDESYYGDNVNVTNDDQVESLHDNEEDDEDVDGEKEKSVLIERDGKFELVDPSEVEAGIMDMLCESEVKVKMKVKEKVKVKVKEKVKVKVKEKVKVKVKESGSKSGSKSVETYKNLEYLHVTSDYALTETQVEMKKRRVSVRNMRINEEKQRRQEKEEKQRVENRKSYRKWMRKKSSSVEQQRKNEAEISADEEKRKIAEKSYDEWLRQKELQQNHERKLEKLRIADEADHYIIRDRVMCEKSFQQWLKQKKVEENKTKVPMIQTYKRSSRIVAKQKPVTYGRKIQPAASRSSSLNQVERSRKNNHQPS